MCNMNAIVCILFIVICSLKCSTQIEVINFDTAYDSQEEIQVFFRADDPVPVFIGRTEELMELDWTVNDKKVIVITGIKGVGKTELVRKFFEKLKSANASNIIFIDSTTISSTRLAFRDLARYIDLRPSGKITLSMILNVIKHFENKQSLFVFDNASYNNSDLKAILGFLRMMDYSKYINVIITSRLKEWSHHYKIIPVKPFNLKESRMYIKRSLFLKVPFAVEDEHADKITDMTGFLPQDLSNIVTHIIDDSRLHPHRDISDYINEMERRIPKMDVILRPKHKDVRKNNLERLAWRENLDKTAKEDIFPRKYGARVTGRTTPIDYLTLDILQNWAIKSRQQTECTTCADLEFNIADIEYDADYTLDNGTVSGNGETKDES